jgi:hypothetical protein
VVNAGTDQVITLPTDTANLSGTATDDGLPGATLTTTWSVYSGPDVVSFGDSTSLSTTATFFTEGTYILRLTADDTEYTSFDEMEVTILTPGSDTIPPQVNIVVPAEDSYLARTVDLSANATDNIAVSRIDFYAEGVFIDSVTSEPFTVSWDTSGLANGSYAITAYAIDAVQNESEHTININVDNGEPSYNPPYPYSTYLKGLEWANPDTMIRKAQESDGWAITWADDGDQYTSYGDGWGFRHESPIKLSLGYAKIIDGPTDFEGINIWSPTGDLPVGNGDSGKKSCGMLMVDRVLYMWVRNAVSVGRGSQLVWSDDYAQTWHWMNWKIPELGFICLVNFGQNYAGARDNFVYAYSPNTNHGRRETDSVVLLRVPMDEILDRNAYEFFRGFDGDGNPLWTSDIAQREPVFEFPGGCNRMDVTYNARIGRYIMTMRSRARNGGLNQFSMYEAPEPWGPWSTLYYTETYFGQSLTNLHGGWDESQHVPSKWMGPDDNTFWLLSSSFDSFAVLRGRLTIDNP